MNVMTLNIDNKHKIVQVSIQIEIRKLGEPGANSETDYTKMSSIPLQYIVVNTTGDTIPDMSDNTTSTAPPIPDGGATANTVSAIPDDGTTARKYLFWLKSIFLCICLFTTVIIGYVIIFTTVNRQYRTLCISSFLGLMLMCIRYLYNIICKKKILVVNIDNQF